MEFKLPYIKKEIEEAQDIALRFCNFKSDNLTIRDLRKAMVVLSNCVEDVLFQIKHKEKS